MLFSRRGAVWRRRLFSAVSKRAVSAHRTLPFRSMKPARPAPDTRRAFRDHHLRFTHLPSTFPDLTAPATRLPAAPDPSRPSQETAGPKQVLLKLGLASCRWAGGAASLGKGFPGQHQPLGTQSGADRPCRDQGWEETRAKCCWGPPGLQRQSPSGEERK